MSRPEIIEAAVVQKVRYESRTKMLKVNAQKRSHGQRIVYKRVDEQADGSVIAMIMFPYGNKPLLGDSLGMNNQEEE